MKDHGREVPPDAERGRDFVAALGLAWLSQAGAHSLLRLLSRFGPEQIWGAGERTLEEWGISSATAARFVRARASFSVGHTLNVLRKAGVTFVPYGSALYPEGLTNLSHPPAGLFAKGQTQALAALQRIPRITIVGTRRASHYGLRAARAFSSVFARAGVAVISGLALGVDGEAHRAALAASGVTAAVLGCGVDVVYPKRHQALYEAVGGQGILLSELPPGTLPSRWTFPQRNRLLAAIGDAVLVIEGSLTSGALQTATEAACLGRPVLAVPGPVDINNHRGCNQLIYEGALPAIEPAQAVQDFLSETRIARRERTQLLPSSAVGRVLAEGAGGLQVGVRGLGQPEQAAVLAQLAVRPCTLEDIVVHTGLPARRAAALVSELELDGLVVQRAPGTYIRAP